ncbi:AbrB/MazE/SpoVT family DNA-binding domain-containing protein [Enterococcus avium]|uniref:AbrB/MazE/SpoVT family DNA-binding domain-containing protein n=1 Tax=Enterococcus avium TaxID=33945 RepID=A0AAW8SJ01_ENTAV|nr:MULTISPECIES: AbrB/MazE/SpoVT family DNA-binding domain-containing protein [Enterococcus]MDT2401789.1 AbrB/MazE/SpoVT family DNA-binding domain-containing protein [Enterococcus avium]MDT2434231.1 AbrB/MazE/SpoVT family DNA-binding domain-containing protein [Enterococcus avium]MDT2466129.1 AbrB/MazE/SpoVT family DNA-binding domain-containing protein [Enterococcus avium]MDT2484076.1 AbrB/MazE/SpoVT family DNA-binding domain-containing protein [Enterococcus avium]MDT2505555.1 AbrB/MazE/SpoVT f
MEVLKILKWGNSSGMRIPKSIMKTMDLHENDQVQLEVEVIDGKRRLVIQPENDAKDPTIEELFENYHGDRRIVELQDLGEAVGNEKW